MTSGNVGASEQEVKGTMITGNPVFTKTCALIARIASLLRHYVLKKHFFILLLLIPISLFHSLQCQLSVITLDQLGGGPYLHNGLAQLLVVSTRGVGTE